MSLEIILDILLSAFTLAVYHSDCEQQPAMAYACASSEPPLWGDHQEYYKRGMSRPEDYDDPAAVLTTDAAWIDDPMEDKELDELFRMADAIEPMEAEVADEIQAIDAEVERFYVETEPVRTKVAKVVQLKALVKKLYSETPKGNKAELTERVLSAFAKLGTEGYALDGDQFIISDDKQSVLVVLK